MFGWSGIPATCEVSGLFQHLIPQDALNRAEIRNQSHIMIPDFRLEMPSTTPSMDLAPGESATKLAELKYTCSKVHYKPGVRQREFVHAVDKRAGELMGEYRYKAERMDRLLGEQEEGRGRVRSRLDEFGDLITIVVGKYNKLSNDGHKLLDAMAASRVVTRERMSGKVKGGRAEEKGIIQGQLR